MKNSAVCMRVLLLASFLGCSSKDDASANGAAGFGAQVGGAGKSAGGAGRATGGTPSSGGAPNTGGAPSAGASGIFTGGASPGIGGAGSGGVSTAGANTGGAHTGGNAAMAGSSQGASGSVGALNGADPKFLIFLLLGQSNMVGAPQPQSQDQQQDPRIKVLAYDNCTNVNRKYNQWYPASPPLHQCDAGVGPGDYFAKTLLPNLPAGYTIGLVPTAVNGAPIDLFRRGVPRTGYMLPPDNHWATGYEFIVSRAKEAQKVGVIRGILFHQGESNREQMDWVDKVKGLVTDLRTDLSIGDVPFLAGELYYNGCCKSHNALVQQLTDSVSNGFLVSASGLNGVDTFHFDLAGQRELGKRYGTAMQEALTLP